MEEEKALQNEVTNGAPKEKKNHTAIIALIILVLVAAIGYRAYYFYKKLKVSDPVKITTNKIKELAASSNDVLKGSDFFSKDKATIMTIDGKVGDYKINIEGGFDLKNSIAQFTTAFDEKGNSLLYLDGKITASEMFIQLAKNSNAYKASSDFAELFKTMTDYSSMVNNDSTEKFSKYLADSFEATFTKDDFTKSKEKITVFDKEMDVTKFETVIDEKDLVKMMTEFVDKISKDDEFLESVADLSKAMGEEVTKADLKAGFVEMKKQIAESEVDKVSIKYSIFVKGADVVRYAFNIPEFGKINIDEYKNDSGIKIDADQAKIEYTYNKKSTEYAIKMNGVSFVTGTYKETIKKNDVSTSITFSVPMLMLGGELNTRVYVTDKVTDKTYNNALDLNDANNAYKFMDELSKNEFLNGMIESLSSMFTTDTSWDSIDGIEF